jgi:hypothetical protein
MLILELGLSAALMVYGILLLIEMRSQQKKKARYELLSKKISKLSEEEAEKIGAKNLLIKEITELTSMHSQKDWAYLGIIINVISFFGILLQSMIIIIGACIAQFILITHEILEIRNNKEWVIRYNQMLKKCAIEYPEKMNIDE